MKKIAIGIAVFVVLGVIGSLMKAPATKPIDLYNHLGEGGTKFDGASKPTLMVTPTPTPTPSAKGEVTKANFLRLTTGMTYAEVVSILGSPGEELSRVEMAGAPVTVMYMWKASGLAGLSGANMNVMFQGDRLVTKSQFGL